MDWLSRVVDPRFALFQEILRLTGEVQELENRNRLIGNAALERDFRTAVKELAAGRESNREICGINLAHWLEEIIGYSVQSSFFAKIQGVRQGLTKNGCLLLEPLKTVNDLTDLAPRIIPLDKFSCMVTALDRALSVVVVEYAHADPEVKQLFDDHPIHSGLLIRAFLGETDAVRTLYPKHVVGIPGKPELDETVISKTRHAFEYGEMARICSEHYGLEENTLQTGMERAVSIQRKILPLLPFEIHHFADVLEARFRIRQMTDKLEAAGGHAINQEQIRNLHANLNAQNSRGRQIARRLRTDFRIDPSKMFFLDESLMDELRDLFGSELGFLRTVLARHIKRKN